MIIGIGGVSRSGKTSLAVSLKSKLVDAEILSLDDYPSSRENFTFIKNTVDWEHPSSLDFNRIIEDINLLKNKHEIVIVEGIFIFHHSVLKRLIDKFIFINLEKYVFLSRKKEDGRWGYVPAWYREHIWESHLHYGAKSLDCKIFELDGAEEFDYEQVLDFIKC